MRVFSSLFFCLPFGIFSFWFFNTLVLDIFFYRFNVCSSCSRNKVTVWPENIIPQLILDFIPEICSDFFWKLRLETAHYKQMALLLQEVQTGCGYDPILHSVLWAALITLPDQMGGILSHVFNNRFWHYFSAILNNKHSMIGKFVNGMSFSVKIVHKSLHSFFTIDTWNVSLNML